jgi:hypothetical protein
MCNITAGCDSSFVIRDEDDIGPTCDIRSPIEACACIIFIRKRTLRDGEGSAAWDGAVKVDGSTWRYVSRWRKTVRPAPIWERLMKRRTH